MPADGNVTTQSPDDVRKNLRTILDDLRTHSGHAVIIERYRTPVAAIISYEDYLSVAPLLHRQPAPAQ